jgi:hypothetical protein
MPRFLQSRTTRGLFRDASHLVTDCSAASPQLTLTGRGCKLLVFRYCLFLTDTPPGGSFGTRPGSSLRMELTVGISNDLAFWQNGDPAEPSIVSKQINVAYWERQCPLWFPTEDGVSIPKMSQVNHVNALYDGWDIRYVLLVWRSPFHDASYSEDHLLFVNGQCI